MDRQIKQQATYFVYGLLAMFTGTLVMIAAIALAAWWSIPTLLFITPTAAAFLWVVSHVQRVYGPNSWVLAHPSNLEPLNNDSAVHSDTASKR